MDDHYIGVQVPLLTKYTILEEMKVLSFALATQILSFGKHRTSHTMVLKYFNKSMHLQEESLSNVELDLKDSNGLVNDVQVSVS